jgi:hypothetical protein
MTKGERMIHSNIFLHYDDMKQVYQKFIEDQRRDLKRLNIHGLIVACCLVAAFMFPDYRLPILLMVPWPMLQFLFVAMDMSNRNWFLHMLDYEDWKQRQAGRFEGPRDKPDIL